MESEALQQFVLWIIATVLFLGWIFYLKLRRHRRVQERKKFALRKSWVYRRGNDPSISYEIEGKSKTGEFWSYTMHRSEDAFAVDSSGEWEISGLSRINGNVVVIPIPSSFQESEKDREKMALRVLHFMPGNLNQKLTRIKWNEDEDLNQRALVFSESRDLVEELFDLRLRSIIASFLETAKRSIHPVFHFQKDRLTMRTIRPVSEGPDIEKLTELGERIAVHRNEQKGEDRNGNS